MVTEHIAKKVMKIKKAGGLKINLLYYCVALEM